MGQRLSKLYLLLTLLGCAVGCQPPEEAPACPAGEVQDEETAACVPEACGTGTWGLIERDEDTIHVAPSGDNDNDGSEAQPYRTVQKGANEAGEAGGGLVAVAAGTYTTNLGFGTDHEGVEIQGRCTDLVVIDGSEEDEPGIEVSGGTVAVRSLAVIGGLQGIRVVKSGFISSVTFIGEDLLLADNRSFGIATTGNGSNLQLEDVTIRDTQLDANQAIGLGIAVEAGASLVAHGLLLERNHQYGLIAQGQGTTVELEDATIRDTRPIADGYFGRGIDLYTGASLVARGLLLEGNCDLGLGATDEGTVVELEDATIRDTQTDIDGLYGRGIDVQLGARLVARGLRVDNNYEYGLVAIDPGTEVDLEDATISNTLPLPGGNLGFGMAIEQGPHLVARNVILAGNYNVGINLTAGSTATLEELTVRDTQISPIEIEARGIEVSGAATLVAQGVLIEDNRGIGLSVGDSETTVNLDDVTIRNTQPLPDGTRGRGINIQDGPTVVARGLQLEGNVELGLRATGAGTNVDLTDVIVSETRAPSDNTSGFGIVVEQLASVTGHNLQIADNQGPGLYLTYDGTLEATEVHLERNTFAGAVVLGGRLLLNGGSTTATSLHPSEGGGVGVFARTTASGNTDFSPDIQLENMRFSNLPGPALYVRNQGRFQVQGCDITDAGTWPSLPGGVLAVEGVEAWQELGATGEFAGLSLEGNTFEGLHGDAILLDRSSATLSSHPETAAPNVFSDLQGEPLVWQRCNDSVAPEILDSSTEVPSCTEEARVLGPLLEYDLWLTEAVAIE